MVTAYCWIPWWCCIYWHWLCCPSPFLFFFSFPFFVHDSFSLNPSSHLIVPLTPTIPQHWQPAEDNCRSPALRKQVTCFWVGLGVPPSPRHSAHLSSSTTLLFSLSSPAPWQQSLRLPWGASAAATAAFQGPTSPRLLVQAPVTSWARAHAPRKLPAQAPPPSAPSAKPRRHPWERPWLSDWTQKFPPLPPEAETSQSFIKSDVTTSPLNQSHLWSIARSSSLFLPAEVYRSQKEGKKRKIHRWRSDRKTEGGWRELQSEERVSNQIMTHSWEEWHGRVSHRAVHLCFSKNELKEGRTRLWLGIGRPKNTYQGSHVVSEDRHLTKKKIHK